MATTVISHKPESGHMVVDCGWTAIGQDGLWLTKEQAPLGCCPVEGHPELRLNIVSDFGLQERYWHLVPGILIF